MSSTDAKPLEDLTEGDFNKLREVGLLTSIYPDAPSEYAQIRGVAPLPLAKPDFSEVTRSCKCYLDEVTRGEIDSDTKHYIFEAAMIAVYGTKVFDYINRRL